MPGKYIKEDKRGVYDPFDTPPEAEEMLWRQVIAQALKDATLGMVSRPKGCQRRHMKPNKREIRQYLDAVDWLTKDPVFSNVCRLAGWDPEYMRDRSVGLIDLYASRVKELMECGREKKPSRSM